MFLSNKTFANTKYILKSIIIVYQCIYNDLIHLPHSHIQHTCKITILCYLYKNYFTHTLLMLSYVFIDLFLRWSPKISLGIWQKKVETTLRRSTRWVTWLHVSCLSLWGILVSLSRLLFCIHVPLSLYPDLRIHVGRWYALLLYWYADAVQPLCECCMT